MSIETQTRPDREKRSQGLSGVQNLKPGPCSGLIVHPVQLDAHDDRLFLLVQPERGVGLAAVLQCSDWPSAFDSRSRPGCRSVLQWMTIPPMARAGSVLTGTSGVDLQDRAVLPPGSDQNSSRL